MKQRWIKLIAVIMAVMIIVVSVPQIAAFAVYEGTPPSSNWGIRGQACTTFDGSDALAYYVGDYSYAELSALPADELMSELNELMTTTHTYISHYDDCRDLAYWTDCQANNTKYATTLYTSYQATVNQWKGNNSAGWDREHVWPQNLGGGNTKGGGADLHHVRPSESNINSTRNNLKYGNVEGGSNTNPGKLSGTVGGSYADGYFEPLDNVKGDVARIILYVYVRWGADWGADSVTDVFQSVDVLLEWCALDPVDTWEMGRNDVVEDIQGNRNVFIDYPELAWQLFDKTAPENMSSPSDGVPNPEATAPAPPVETTKPTPDSVETEPPVIVDPGASVTVKKTISDLATKYSWANETQCTEFWLDYNIKISAAGGSLSGKYFTSGTNWRIYQSDSGAVTVSAKNGMIIDTVKISYSVYNSGTLTLNGSNVPSNTVVDVDASSITFGMGSTGTNANGQARITAIEVTYTREADAPVTTAPVEPDVTEKPVTTAPVEPEVTEKPVTTAPTEPDVTEAPTVPDTTETTTVSVSIADVATKLGWTNSKKYSTFSLDSNITASAVGGSNTGKYYSSNGSWRVYQNETPRLVISANEGKTIVSVKITYAFGSNGTMTRDSVNVASGEVVIVNAESVTFSVAQTEATDKANGNIQITAIEVTYVGEGNTPAEPEETTKTPEISETEAPEATTEAPEVTTEAPEVDETTEAPEVDETTEAPVVPEIGATVTVGDTIENIASKNNWADATKYTEIKLDNNITVSALGKGNTGKFYVNGNNWRIYQTENPTITISAAEGLIIKSVKMTYNVNSGGVLTLNGANVTSETAVSVNASSVTFGVGNTGTATNGQVRITAIEVTYASDATEPAPEDTTETEAPATTETEAPVVDETTEAPEVDETTEAPEVDETTEAPVVDETTEAPVVDETTEAPVVDETTDTPVVDETTEAPVVDETTESPEVDETTEAPVVDETTETPEVDETTEAPEIDETTEAPEVDETTEAPEVDETTEAPEVDETTEAPEVDETTEAPVVDETTETPEVDETTEAPVVDETTEAPEADETIEVPTDAETETNAPENTETETKEPVSTAPGNEQTTESDAEGGKQTGGCGSSLSGGFAIIAVISVAAFTMLRKKRED